MASKLLKTSGPALLAALLATLAPRVAGATVRLDPKARPGDCAACHGAAKVLPPGHVATRAMKAADCARCHDPAGPKALGAKLPSGHRHGLAGVGCADCHGKAAKPQPASVEACLACHGPAAELVKKTAAVKPENPHDSPHWGPQMECSVCHRQHEATVNWCAHCHTFDFKVP